MAGSARAESQNLQASVLKSEAMVRRRTRSPTPEGARRSARLARKRADVETRYKRWRVGLLESQFIWLGEAPGVIVTEESDDEQAPASLLDVAVKDEGTDIPVDTDCFFVDIEGSGDVAAFSQDGASAFSRHSDVDSCNTDEAFDGGFDVESENKPPDGTGHDYRGVRRR